MTMIEYEYRIFKRVKKDMFKATERDGINKVYRQARIWSRIHYTYAGACTYQRYIFLNNKFKNAHREAIAATK